jgi:predicted transposase/invertase (TIGR01784 family)
MGQREAITQAVVDCIDENVLKEFLETHKSEVINMLLTEWSMDTALKVRGEEYWEKGRMEGRMEEKKRTARALQSKGMPVNDIAEATGLTVDDILRL